MLKQELTYETFDGTEVTDTFYFNLSKTEIVEFELGSSGEKFSETLQNVIKAQDVPRIIEMFKKIVLMAYGEKSEDGRSFLKSPERSNAFAQTAAYDFLFMKLARDEQFAAEFVRGIFPKDLQELIDKEDTKETVIVQGREVPKPPR